MIRNEIVYTGTKEDLINKYGFSYLGAMYGGEKYAVMKKHGLIAIRIDWKNKRLFLNSVSAEYIAKIVEMASDLKLIEHNDIDEQIKEKEKELEELRAKKNDIR